MEYLVSKPIIQVTTVDLGSLQTQRLETYFWLRYQETRVGRMIEMGRSPLYVPYFSRATQPAGSLYCRIRPDSLAAWTALLSYETFSELQGKRYLPLCADGLVGSDCR
jgi:hypothetical protein